MTAQNVSSSPDQPIAVETIGSISQAAIIKVQSGEVPAELLLGLDPPAHEVPSSQDVASSKACPDRYCG